MKVVWRDYDPNTMQYIESWLDAGAIQATGLDQGFCAFYEAWAREDGFAVGENFWCKVAAENGQPFAVIAFCQHEGIITIMEFLVAPQKRGQGKGSKLLKAFLESEEIIGCAIRKSEAVIYPDNIASQKAFEKAGFQFRHTHEDGSGKSMHYVYEHRANNTFMDVSVRNTPTSSRPTTF